MFCPVFRLHGIRQPGTMIGAEQTGAANEIWSFGDEQYEIIRRLLFLRERLRPYVMDQMRVARDTGLPPMRPLFVDYPGDPVSWEVEDQFLFGGDILVAPVYTEGARERPVYLPAGSAWLDAWTGAEHAGGQWVTALAPLELVPVYLRPAAGSSRSAPSPISRPPISRPPRLGPPISRPPRLRSPRLGPPRLGPPQTGPAETGPALAETGPAETAPAEAGGE